MVVYKAAKKDCSVTEVMTHYDVNRASRAQYIMAMLINKNSAFGKFGKHQANLTKKKMPFVCLFLASVVSTLTLLLRLWRIKNALGPTVASILPCLEDREAMSFLAFDNYHAILATISFQVTSGLDQRKRRFNAYMFRATSSRRTLTHQEQLAKMFASRISISCQTFTVPYMHQDW